MNSHLLEIMFSRHVPGALREEGDARFDDQVQLNISHILIDEFWSEFSTNFVRDGAHRLFFEDFIESGRGHASNSSEALLKRFLACEMELRVESRMTIQQSRKLAGAYFEIGSGFYGRQWWAHARFCFSRSAGLMAELRDFRRADDCWYWEMLSETKLCGTYLRIVRFPSWLLAGFGYRPYRLLYSAFASIFFFAAVFWVLRPGTLFFENLMFSGMNYLAAVGFGDVASWALLARAVVLLQGIVSLVLNATLFALLVRRWFRA